jgi:hypothetical protein
MTSALLETGRCFKGKGRENGRRAGFGDLHPMGQGQGQRPGGWDKEERERVRHAGPRFAHVRTTGASFISQDLSPLQRDQGSGAPATRRLRTILALAGLAVVSTLALGASQASAAYLHTTVTGEYGKEGPKASGVSGGCNLAYQTATHHLYYFADEKIYGLNRTAPGTVAPLGGGFPISAGINSSCGDRDMTVDNSGTSSAGNIYAVPSSTSIYRWSPSGSALGTISVGGETCGVAVTNTGEVWGGNYGGPSVNKYTSSGSANGTISVNTSFCKLEVDPSNNDLYVAPYSFGVPIRKYTAASGYSSFENFPSAESNNPGMAINGAAHRLYVANGSTVKSYDTTSGALIETISVAAGASSVAVDEATDTIFVAPSGGAIKEISGAVVPDITTGEPISNTGVSGHVDPAGGGEVTECYFEFGTSTAYGSTQECTPATFSSPEDVTAILPGLLGETTYHYRLVAGNANGRNFGGDKTITPHNVKGLRTEEAESVTRTSATLKASFEGNGEETKYYFEWGTTTAYGTQSAVPPGESAGSPTFPPATPLSYAVSGLQPDTLYHYRVVGENGLGISPGQDRTFKTLPAVQSLAASDATNVGARGATLNGSYVGDGDHTTYYFKFGKTTSYGQQSEVLDAGSPSSGTIPLTFDLSGLELETTYHYKIVATNSLGTTESNDKSFTTLPAVGGLTIKPATEIDQEDVTLNAEFTGNGEETSYYFEYGLTTNYGKTSAEPPGDSAGSPTGPTPISAVITDFEGYSTYHYRVVATNSQGTTKSGDMTFESLPAPLPSINQTAASGVSPTEATLEAEINPNRWATVYSFEYGTDTLYGESTEISSSIGSDENPHPVSETVAGLKPGTTYHFRVVAINFTGTSYGPDQAFRTPDAPAVLLSSGTPTGQTSAHLSASVDPNAGDTDVRFEYGASGSYGASTSATPIGSSPGAHQVAADLAGLAAGTTYHFRVVASNQFGNTVGPDETVTTLAAPVQLEPEPSQSCAKGFVKRHGRCVKRPKKCRHGRVKRHGKCVKRKRNHHRRHSNRRHG